MVSVGDDAANSGGEEDAADDSADGSGASMSGRGGDGSATDDGGCAGFLGCDDVPTMPEMCDFWAQDCQDGQKCTNVASTPGSPAWDAHFCVPAGSQAIGESCTLADGPQGTDTCDASSMCFDIDPATMTGTCVGYCQGPEAAPTCPEESGAFICTKLSNGYFNLCLPGCNPLLTGDCPAGQNCVPAFDAGEIGGFQCYPPAAEGLAGEGCACANCCASGLLCVAAEEFGPDCAFDRCCTEHCDITDPSFTCGGSDQQCVALFAPGTPVVGNVGQCVVPSP